MRTFCLPVLKASSELPEKLSCLLHLRLPGATEGGIGGGSVGGAGRL